MNCSNSAFGYFVLVLTFISCSYPNPVQPPNSLKKQTLETPIRKVASSPIVTNLDSCPAPYKVEVKKKNDDTLNSNQNHVDFFVTMQNYNTEQGLAQSSLLCGYKDRAGNLWFGTDGGGVSRYDGKSFTNYTTSFGLAGNSVLSICEDRRGNLWFGTNGGGASCYDGRSFKNFTKSTQLAGNMVLSITTDKGGNIWFGTEAGISMFNGKSFSTLTTANGLINNKVNCIYLDKVGILWFGTDGGVTKYDGHSFVSYSTSEGLVNNKVLSIAQDFYGKFWFGTERGVSMYNGKFNLISSMTDKTVRTITVDRNGSVWFGTAADGAINYDGKTFVSFTTAQGIANNNVRGITEDSNGNLWFGTYGGGLSCYGGKSVSSFTTDQGLADNFINTIVEDMNGNLWFGTDGMGVSCYNGKSFKNFSAINGIASDFIFSSFQDKSGTLWFGTRNNGVTSFDGKSFRTYSTVHGLASNTIWVVNQDNKGVLWFGTDGGITSFDGNYFKTYTTNQGLSQNKIRCITFDKNGNMWLGSVGGGLMLFDEMHFTHFNTEQGIVGNTIWCITNDKAGNVWIGTEGSGLSFLSAEKIDKIKSELDSQVSNKHIDFQNFTTKEGLADNAVYDIVEDKKGNIIIGTNLGFTVLKGGYDTSTKRFAKDGLDYFNQKKGYPVKDIIVNAMYADSKGIIWAGTGEKLIRFDYEAIAKPKTKPLAVIQSLKLNNQSISWYDLKCSEFKVESSNLGGESVAPNITEEAIVFGSTLSDAKRDSMRSMFKDVCFDSITRFYYLPVNLVLPSKFNNLTFDYAAIEPARPYLVRYQFMLEGYDKTWNPVTDRTSASFGNLSQGNYTFKLKAQSPEGVWSEPVRFSFEVLPPWYLTWWAFGLYGLLVVIILMSIIRWRESTLKREKALLEDKVQVRTNELRAERDKSENLLLNIFPVEIAQELKASGSSKPKHFGQVTVLFTDFKNFTGMTEQLNPDDLVNLVDDCYRKFDHIITKYGIEKIKTIGDSYMCAGGLPVENTSNPIDTVMAALEIRDFMLAEKQRRIAEGNPFFEIRIGLHTGSVVAGIVGVKKYAYDIWGKTVNIASRMETSGEPGKVNISEATYQLIKHRFKCTHRGRLEAKNMGMIDMYFVELPV